MSKNEQLGMNPSTASGRLLKDLLFDFVQKAGIKCYHCDGELTRDTFSIEHKTPWLHSEDPKRLFFDLENISYSHLACNFGARRHEPARCGSVTSYDNGCRCDLCIEAKSLNRKKYYTPERRRQQYEKYGT